MFPWESAATGSEVCPSWASTGQLEQHITGDIAVAAQQFWYATKNVSVPRTGQSTTSNAILCAAFVICRASSD